MKVTGQQTSNSQEVKTNQARGKEESMLQNTTAKTNQSNIADSVRTTLLVDKLKDRIAAEPEIRTDKVAELKAQISQGQYKVDAQRLAGKLIVDSLKQGS